MKLCNVCNERHNSWLCSRQVREASAVAAPVTAHVAAISAIGTAGEEVAHAPLLATAIVTVSDRFGQSHSLRTLCDPGSQVNMITTAAHQVLGCGKTQNRINVSGIGGKTATSIGQANISFKSRFDSGNRFYMTAMVLPTITSRLPSTYIGTAEWKHLDGLPLADPNFNIPAEIDIVLGASTFASLVKKGIVKGEQHQPIAQCTKIGWIVYGNINTSSRYLQTLHAVADLAKEPNVDELLTRFWEVEQVPTGRVRSAEEQQCEDIFVANTTRDESGRYIVRIPIKSDAPELGESRTIAVRRLLQMEARFIRKPELKQQYVEFMAEYLKLGHMVAAPPLPKGATHNYIPHHAAATKKFRVVFDGSSKTSNGVAFNDIQMIGEKLQPDLTSITMRFRTNKIALTADIKKMYRQILVCPDQRDMQRIVWRANDSQPIRDYQLVTQTYGLRSAPHNCVRALVQCATDHEAEHPLAAEVAQRDFYIDDMLSGADSVANAEFLYRDITAMLAKAGAELAKWTTNSNEVCLPISQAKESELVTIDKDEADSTVLGLRWNPSSDILRYKILLPKQNEKVTKRRIVSNVAKLYDPNGYLSPVVITAKVLIQKLWQSECTWDGAVPKELATEYAKLMSRLPQLEQLAIPRWIGTTAQSRKELHAFCDASNIAYGCAFYVESTDPTTGTTVRLVASKTRVAPIRRMTIPRLELCGAHLLAKMLHEVCEVHEISPGNCHLWTDSMIVLYWLRKMPSTAKMYVANRIAETAELTKAAAWRHVPTADNPADMASRGIPPGDIITNRLWWEGPMWIAKPSKEWPSSHLQLTDEQKSAIASENSTPVVMVARIPEPFLENDRGDILQQASGLHRLIRVTAWILRFINNVRTTSNRVSGPLAAEEYIASELRWVQHEQEQHFTEEFSCPHQNGALIVPKNSKLVGLKPFIQNGIIRSKGRLENSTLPYDATHPIVLHAASRFTMLVIRSAHLATLHGGTQLTMHYARQKYWVPTMRRITRSVIHHCVTCARHEANPMQQQMASLPQARVTPGRAFQTCGVDYCGPFYIKARGGRCKIVSKSYVAVFVCMVSRGVHLELVSDLTSEAFLAALSRLSSRRGRVLELYSDNGTTFHGADKDITAAVKSWKKLSSNSMFQALYIKWTFIPPLSPHHGGLWEAAVKSAKHHLRRIVGDQQLTFEEFYTVLTQVEACMNSRPITRNTDDSSDSLALTPSHFWALEPIVTPMARDYTETPTNRLQRWKLLQRFVQDFWRRWKSEYLDQLHLRTKWKVEQPNAAVGDVVLVRSENTPPQQWPMGRITNIHPGKDGLVRAVDVLYGGHEYRRSITKLVPLPTTDQE